MQARSLVWTAGVAAAALLFFLPQAASAQSSCAAGFQPVTLSGNIAVCQGAPGAAMPLGSGTTPTGYYVIQGDRAVAVNAQGQMLDENGNTITSPDTNKPVSASTGGECSAFSPGNWFQYCLWNPLLSWLGSWFLTIGGGWLRLAGLLFDNLIFNVIVNFKGTLDTLHITEAINTGWTIFRDFTNILIIGMFTFIALSIILGVKEFGAKKLIANVLIIAVLINFSLLFTRMIIDASNFTAYQIYKQMAGTQKPQTFDIAAGFLRPMGITGVWDSTYLVTAEVAKDTDSAFQAFLYGLVGGILLLTVALVLFYGCFLIMARAVLFIFLMLTAALAFITYLIPPLARGEYGWNSWWKALFNNAVFAPLLMLFLYVSLLIVNEAGKHPLIANSPTTLGSVITHPQSQLTDASAWGVMLVYLLTVGLLFVSFKMAHKFAGTISGFPLAGAVVSAPFAAALRGFAPIARFTGGGTQRANMRRSLELEDEIKTARLRAAQPGGNYNQVLDLMKKKAAADKAASAKTNVLSSDVGKAIAKATFMPKAFTEKPKESYAEKANKIAADAAKTGAAAVLSKSEAEKHVRGEIEKEREAQHIELQQRHAANEELLKAAHEVEHSAKESSGINRARAEQQSIIDQANQESARLNKEKQGGRLSELDHQRLMREQKERIEQANKKLIDIKRQETDLRALHNIPAIEQAHKDTDRELKNFREDVEKEVKKRASALLEQSAKIGEQIAVHEAQHHGDSTMAEMARKGVGGRLKNRDAFNRRKQQKEFDKELDGNH